MLNLRLDTLALHIKKRGKTKSLCDFLERRSTESSLQACRWLGKGGTRPGGAAPGRFDGCGNPDVERHHQPHPERYQSSGTSQYIHFSFSRDCWQGGEGCVSPSCCRCSYQMIQHDPCPRIGAILMNSLLLSDGC